MLASSREVLCWQALLISFTSPGSPQKSRQKRQCTDYKYQVASYVELPTSVPPVAWVGIGIGSLTTK